MMNNQNYKYIISIDNVQISFKDINVLDGVSLNIKKRRNIYFTWREWFWKNYFNKNYDHIVKTKQWKCYDIWL